MDRYTPEHRLLMTYEGLTDDQIGPEVARELNDFLGLAQGVVPIATESVPCVWRAVVKNQPPPQQAAHIEKLQAAAQGQRFAPGQAPRPQAPRGPDRPPDRRRRLNPGHYDSQRKGPAVSRPYTAAQLEGMMTMLAEVAARYQDTDVRLYNIMNGYREKILVRKRREFKSEGSGKEPAAAAADRARADAAGGGAAPARRSGAGAAAAGPTVGPASPSQPGTPRRAAQGTRGLPAVDGREAGGHDGDARRGGQAGQRQGRAGV